MVINKVEGMFPFIIKETAMDRKPKINPAFIFIWCSLVAESVSELKNVEITRAQPMQPTDSSYIDWGTIRLTKSGNRKDLTISGTLKVLKDLEEPEIGLGYALYRKNPVNKSYPTQPFIYYSNPICQTIAQETLLYPDLVAASNFPKPGTCPFPKGSYTVHNFTISEERLHKFMPGDYKLMATFTKDKKFLTGYEFHATLT